MEGPAEGLTMGITKKDKEERMIKLPVGVESTGILMGMERPKVSVPESETAGRHREHVPCLEQKVRG